MKIWKKVWKTQNWDFEMKQSLENFFKPLIISLENISQITKYDNTDDVEDSFYDILPELVG